MVAPWYLTRPERFGILASSSHIVSDMFGQSLAFYKPPGSMTVGLFLTRGLYQHKWIWHEVFIRIYTYTFTLIFIYIPIHIFGTDSIQFLTNSFWTPSKNLAVLLNVVCMYVCACVRIHHIHFSQQIYLYVTKCDYMNELPHYVTRIHIRITIYLFNWQGHALMWWERLFWVPLRERERYY